MPDNELGKNYPNYIPNMKEKSSQFDEKGMKVHQQIKSGNTVQSRYSDTNYKDKIPIRKNMLVKFMDKALKK